MLGGSTVATGTGISHPPLIPGERCPTTPWSPSSLLSLRWDTVEADGTTTRSFPSLCSAPVAAFLRQQEIFTKA